MKISRGCNDCPRGAFSFPTSFRQQAQRAAALPAKMLELSNLVKRLDSVTL
jgi:hypothetical protein